MLIMQVKVKWMEIKRSPRTKNAVLVYVRIVIRAIHNCKVRGTGGRGLQFCGKVRHREKWGLKRMLRPIPFHASVIKDDLVIS